MINTVIFDIGMVLVYFRWKELWADLGFEGEKYDIIKNATIDNPWWDEFDKGQMATEELVEKFVERAPQYKKEFEKIFDYCEDFIEPYDYATSWIRELKTQGYKVYVLSNWSEPCYQANKDGKLQFVKEADGAVFSYQEGVIKPAKEIYQLLCDRYEIDPKKAVFLDDNAANIEGAKAFGLNTIHFKTYAQAKEELNKYLEEK